MQCARNADAKRQRRIMDNACARSLGTRARSSIIRDGISSFFSRANSSSPVNQPRLIFPDGNEVAQRSSAKARTALGYHLACKDAEIIDQDPELLPLGSRENRP